MLGDVDRLAREHRVGALAQAGVVGELDQQPDRLVGHPVLGVVEEQSLGLGDHPLAAIGIGGEQVLEMLLADLGVMGDQGIPSGQPLHARLAGGPDYRHLSSPIRPRSPCRRCIRADRSTSPRTSSRPPTEAGRRASSTSMPAAANSASSDSLSPPSGGISPVQLAVLGVGEQRLLGHRVDGVRSGELVDVLRLRQLRILGPGGCEEQPLRARSLVLEPLPAIGVEQLPVGDVGADRRRDPEPVLELGGHLVGDRHVPAADEHRRDRLDRSGPRRARPAARSPFM